MTTLTPQESAALKLIRISFAPEYKFKDVQMVGENRGGTPYYEILKSLVAKGCLLRKGHIYYVVDRQAAV